MRSLTRGPHLAGHGAIVSATDCAYLRLGLAARPTRAPRAEAATAPAQARRAGSGRAARSGLRAGRPTGRAPHHERARIISGVPSRGMRRGPWAPDLRRNGRERQPCPPPPPASRPRACRGPARGWRRGSWPRSSRSGRRPRPGCRRRRAGPGPTRRTAGLVVGDRQDLGLDGGEPERATCPRSARSGSPIMRSIEPTIARWIITGAVPLAVRARRTRGRSARASEVELDGAALPLAAEGSR